MRKRPLSMVGWLALLASVTSPAYAAESEITFPQRRATPQTSVDRISSTLMCPSCDTTLDQSNSPAATRMRAYVRAAVKAGWTEREIRNGLVREYGGDESVLAVPRASGTGLVVWLVPAAIMLIALGGGVAIVARWRRHASSTSTSSETSSPSSTQ